MKQLAPAPVVEILDQNGLYFLAQKDRLISCNCLFFSLLSRTMTQKLATFANFSAFETVSMLISKAHCNNKKKEI